MFNGSGTGLYLSPCLVLERKEGDLMRSSCAETQAEEFYLVSKETGEITESYYLKDGDKLVKRTAKQQESDKKYYQRKSKEGERFVFIDVQKGFSGLKPVNSARMVYLSTYANYDNVLMLNQFKPMKKSDLAKVLGIPDRTMRNFWKEVYPEYLNMDENKVLRISGAYFRGQIDGNFKEYQRFYFEAIRSIYKRCVIGKKGLKNVGKIFNLTPYINREYNILCEREQVFETDITKIRGISVRDFADLVGCGDISNIKKVLNEYNTITFCADGKEQRFIRFMCDKDLDAKTMRVYLNPLAFYAGNNAKRMKLVEQMYANDAELKKKHQTGT